MLNSTVFRRPPMHKPQSAVRMSFDDEVVKFLLPGHDAMAYLFVFVFGKRRRKSPI
jgi:hypothetical protein